jgi:hypothetical protein
MAKMPPPLPKKADFEKLDDTTSTSTDISKHPIAPEEST